MNKFTYKQYTVNLCTDIEEWAKEFYDMPDGATIENIDEVTSECMGFADTRTNEIYIYVPSEYKVEDVYATLAHEIGHCQNHIPSCRTNKQHEQKADAYETFFCDVVRIYNTCIDMLIEQHR